jgi:hypothetical protein
MTVTVFGANAGNSGGCVDTHIREANATTNYGSDTTIEINRWNTNDTAHAVARFTGVPAVIPTSATINSVTMTCYISSWNGTDTNFNTGWYELKRAFVDTQATWNIYSTGNNWQTAGGFGANDAGGLLTSYVTGPVTAGNPATFPTSAELVTYVQTCVAAAADPQFIAQRIDDTPFVSMYLVSANGTAGQRPILTVDWSSGPAPRIIVPTTSINL